MQATYTQRLALMLGLMLTTSARAEEAVVFTNAAIETAGKSGRIAEGALIIRNGKIEAVGPSVKIPDGARVIDARGKTIMPGIIDPFHEVNIAAATADTGPRTVVIGGRSVTVPARSGGITTGFTRVADNFYAFDTGYRGLPRSGLTGLNLVTSGYGQSAIVRITPAQPDHMMVNADGVVFTAVSNESSSLDVVRIALETADRLKKGMSVTLPTTPPPAAQTPPPARQTQRGGGRRGGQGRGQGGFGGFTPGLNQATLKLWQAVHEGKSPLFVNAASAAAIVHLLKAVEPYKDVRLVLNAPGPAILETIDRMVGRPVRLIIRPGLSLKPNTRDRVALANAVNDLGLEFAFTHGANTGDLTAAQDFPLFSVAYLVKCGLPRKPALESLTVRPAAMLGLDKSHGSIEPTKSADLLIFSGDPLDPASQLIQVLIEGRSVYEN